MEDEKKLAGFIIKGLQQAGHLVSHADNGAEGLQIAASEDFDLLLLDLMLAGANGFEVLKNLRSFSIDVPAIITSALTDTKHVVEGLDLGAVDYIKKPFEWDELMARIRIIQRKIAGTAQLTLNVSNLSLNLASRSVNRAGKEIALTAKEFSLLEYLVRNANRIVTRNQLLENIWGLDFDPESNIVEVYMHQLRKKINKGFEQPLIETMVGAGYMLKGNKSH